MENWRKFISHGACFLALFLNPNFIGLGLRSLTGINGYLNTILGLGSASGNKNLTLYTDRQVSIYIKTIFPLRNSSTGVLTIGKPDSTRCLSDWTFIQTVTPSSSQKYWEIPLSRYISNSAF